jgi:ATP-dependent DNA helicase RecG
VGSGKTVVAAAALVQAVENGWQGAFMAPTEILAEQHLVTLSRWLAPLDISIAYLSGRLSEKQRDAALARVANGEDHLVVGTHALIQDRVTFSRLGLAVIDEQHRFGVHQRLSLRQKGERSRLKPHQLIMTATPIPRTLAMTAYADLDLSVIDELPGGRLPIETVIIPNTRRADVAQRVARACQEGRQAYWVCTLVDESEALQAQAASETWAWLGQTLPELRVGLVHGRMPGAQKQEAMDVFKRGAVDVLVATTVIEVGVDVPRASLMVIENAERLGLAQLHQLRGRIGRGVEKSHCVLLYRSPLSQEARERLTVIRDHADGFEIARKDLEQRGPGELLGTRQTGLVQFRVADLVRDEALIPVAQELGGIMLEGSPSQIEPLLRRWLGNGVHYGDV